MAERKKAAKRRSTQKPTSARTTAITKAADAVRALGRFIAPYVSAPMQEGSGIVTDTLAYYRWERAQRFQLRAEKFAQEHGLRAPTRRLPLSVAVPLLQAATLEEDDDLQDMFARLLVNGGDATQATQPRASFVDILKNLSPLDASIMRALYSAPPEQLGKAYISQALPDVLVPFPSRDRMMMFTGPNRNRDGMPEPAVMEALWNLRREGCVSLDWIDTQADSATEARLVSLTPLGIALMRACSPPR